MSCQPARFAILTLVLLGSACKDDKVRPATEVVVAVDSDLSAGDQLQRIEVQVQNAEGESVDESTFQIVTGKTSKKSEATLPFSFGVSKSKSSDFQLVVQGFGDGDEPRVEHKVKGSFQDGKSLLLVVFLSKLCLDNVCGDGETCYSEARSGVAAGDCGDLPAASLGPLRGNGLPGLAGRGGTNPEAGTGAAGRAGTDGRAGGAGGAGEAGRGGGAGTNGAAGRGGYGGYDGYAGAAANGGRGGGAATCTGCKPSEKCVNGRCECATPLSTYYEDFDGDGHGDPKVPMMGCGPAPTGYVTSKDDCCDEDADAFPGQMLGYDVEVACDEGGYDYNCNGVEELGFPAPDSGTCCVSWVNGWSTTPIPACGELGTLIVCNTTTCAVETGYNIAQICR